MKGIIEKIVLACACAFMLWIAWIAYAIGMVR